jgi:N-methylhydantoinase A/oxoprolinase/acetone carboxylase beta subunit
VKRPAAEVSSATAAVLDLVDGQAVHIEDVLNVGGPFVDVDGLVRRGAMAEIAVTPTDLLHCAGELAGGCSAAAEKGVALLAARARTEGVSLLASARWAVGARLAREVAARALADDLGGREPGDAESALLAHLLDGGDGVLRSRLSLGVPLVAVGAPAAAWFPTAREMLGCDLVVPEHADVANAFGALAGRVIARAQALVKAEPDETFLVVTPTVRERFGDKTGAVVRAEQLAAKSATEVASAAGADEVTVVLGRDEVVAHQAKPGDDVFVEMVVSATALGRPFL